MSAETYGDVIRKVMDEKEKGTLKPAKDKKTEVERIIIKARKK